MSKVERHTKRLKLAAKNPGPWREMTVTGDMRAEAPHLAHLAKRFYNARFQVDIFNCSSPIGGVVRVVVLRHGLLEAPTAQEMQNIKNELFGAEVEGVEIFPAKTLDVPQTVRHMWLLPTTWALPFGFTMDGAWGGL